MPRHIPERMCIVCRQRFPQSELLRMVRTPDHEVQVDPGERISGRGAYVCQRPECRRELWQGNRLASALHTEIDQQTKAELQRTIKELEADCE